ncbi:GNAT family N-acetyltransferase [Rhodobacterales bacterium HKCCSP123]|nr:GNAT family N-acetyltransferase [Rhodobacterales bacterium HKCCSP123]
MGRSPLPILRPGQPADADDLARLHVSVWRETYGHLAPQEALHRLDEAYRLPYWRATLADPDQGTGAIVGGPAGRSLGVIAFGRAALPDGTPALEVKHLYVLPSARGTGLGAALLRAGLGRGRALGLSEVFLAVVRENQGARRFYAAMGGTETDGFTDPGPLWRSENIRVRWRLAAAPATAGP